MKRRNFLSTAGIAIAASSTTTGAVAISVFNDMSAHASWQAFSTPARNVLSNFEKEVAIGLASFADKAALIKNIVRPVRVIAQKNEGGQESIVYKNGAGNYIKVTILNGVEWVKISNDWMDA